MAETARSHYAGDGRLHVFYLRSGFEYFFVLQLIEHLGLERVLFVMHAPREGVEERAAEHHPVIFTKDDVWQRRFGKKVSKLAFAWRVFREAGLRGERIRFYSPVYNETCVYALRELMERFAASVEYAMIPDGAALLRHLPRPERSPRVRWLEAFYRAERADETHSSGVHSAFIDTVYHYPAKGIQADPEKIEIVPVPTSDRGDNGHVFVVGGLGGVTEPFVRGALAAAGELPVRFRMHPRNRSGIEHIERLAPHWQELDRLEGSFEEHLLASPYRRVLGPYSTSLMFNHLFVAASSSCFLIDAAGEDPDWQAAAEACGIPIIKLDEPAPDAAPAPVLATGGGED